MTKSAVSAAVCQNKSQVSTQIDDLDVAAEQQISSIQGTLYHISPLVEKAVESAEQKLMEILNPYGNCFFYLVFFFLLQLYVMFQLLGIITILHA